MGSRFNNDLNFAYIAGFLDGDGSLMFQIKKRKDGNRGWRFMFTICLYQDTRHEKPLLWMRKKLGIGYIFRRNDHITELRINGYAQTCRILELLGSFIRFKKEQTRAMLRATKLLKRKSVKQLTKKDRVLLADCLLAVQNANYATRKKKTKEEIFALLDLTP